MTKPTPGPWIWVGKRLGQFHVQQERDEIVLWPGNAVEPKVPLDKDHYQEYWKSVLGSAGKTCEAAAPWNAMLLAEAPTMYEWMKKYRASIPDGSRNAKEIDKILKRIDVEAP